MTKAIIPTHSMAFFAQAIVIWLWIHTAGSHITNKKNNVGSTDDNKFYYMREKFMQFIVQHSGPPLAGNVLVLW